MQTSLSGKTALVTGASNGIGRAIAAKLADSGAAVGVHYFRNRSDAEETVRQIQSRGGSAIAVQGDLTKEADAEAVIAAVAAAFGPIHILINNAGDHIGRCTLDEMTAEFWDSTMDLNIRSAFFCTRAAVKQMPDGGRIVNIASSAGFNGGGPGSTAYSAAKGAVVSWTRALAKELAPRQITCNGAAPGFIDTRFHQIHNTPETLKERMQGVALGRMGRPEEVAALTAFLASDLAGYITGEVVHINGGQYFG